MALIDTSSASSQTGCSSPTPSTDAGRPASYATASSPRTPRSTRTSSASCPPPWRRSPTASSPGGVRDLVEANLDDELHRPCAHVDLLAGFLDAVGAADAPSTPATAALVELYRTAHTESAAFALGVVCAYELQAAAVARSKAEGLRAHYGLDDDATRFWDVHAGLEADHAAWTLAAAATLGADEVLRGVAASRDAWWSFLDEREALAPAS